MARPRAHIRPAEPNIYDTARAIPSNKTELKRIERKNDWLKVQTESGTVKQKTKTPTNFAHDWLRGTQHNTTDSHHPDTAKQNEQMKQL